MKIYLASRYNRIAELCAYRKELQAIGHTVTSRWLNGNHQIGDDGLSAEGSATERERFAREDFSDLMQAELCISFTEAPRSTSSRGGRHVEHGIALGAMKRAWVCGPRENIFHCLEDVRVFGAWADCIVALKS